ncbi:MAG: hypothetical protein BRC31_01825 [Actinobacteria bacterium QS_5_72_10]|nr:MAG: hypothetical protein BRC31_01825 [Actinobacteria bacterium QS_5_72_10]
MMRIQRVVAEAFGPFAGRELEPAPGMTVVWGTNETGKSTWHAAIYAAVCGLRRAKGPPRKAEREFAARRRPWDDDRWRVQATAELADGRTLEFYQDLAGKVDCRIRDAVLGTDLSDELMCDGSPDGAVLFGLTRQTLLATAWVGQADVLGVLDNPEALQESLQRAAATGGSDDTAEAALQRLQAFHRERVGTERRNSTKPLRQAIVAEQTAKAELDAAQQAHQEYLAVVGRRDDARRAAEAAAATLRGAQATLAARRLAQAQRRHEQVAELAQEFADGPPEAPEEPGALDEQIAQALAAWQARPDEPAPRSPRRWPRRSLPGVRRMAAWRCWRKTSPTTTHRRCRRICPRRRPRGRCAKRPTRSRRRCRRLTPNRRPPRPRRARRSGHACSWSVGPSQRSPARGCWPAACWWRGRCCWWPGPAQALPLCSGGGRRVGPTRRRRRDWRCNRPLERRPPTGARPPAVKPRRGVWRPTRASCDSWPAASTTAPTPHRRPSGIAMTSSSSGRWCSRPPTDSERRCRHAGRRSARTWRRRLPPTSPRVDSAPARPTRRRGLSR